MIRLFVQNTAAMLSRRDCTWLKGSEAIRKRGRGERTYASPATPQQTPKSDHPTSQRGKSRRETVPLVVSRLLGRLHQRCFPRGGRKRRTVLVEPEFGEDVQRRCCKARSDTVGQTRGVIDDRFTRRPLGLCSRFQGQRERGK
jgi:hypothetical protein